MQVQRIGQDFKPSITSSIILFADFSGNDVCLANTTQSFISGFPFPLMVVVWLLLKP
jgi:hypothetical protein